MCTGIRFTDADGAMYFGRNLDWTQGYGERVVMTPPAARVSAAFPRPDDAGRGHAVIGMGILVGDLPLYLTAGTTPAWPSPGSTSPRATVTRPSPPRTA